MATRLRASIRVALLELVSVLDQVEGRQPQLLPPAIPPEAPLAGPWRDSHRRIVAAANQFPQSAKKLLRKAGLKVNGSSRQLVTDLVRAGELVRKPEGYLRG